LFQREGPISIIIFNAKRQRFVILLFAFETEWANAYAAILNTFLRLLMAFCQTCFFAVTFL